ncbi:MAG: DUF6115 domain-containing protein [Roseburia sp.]
MTGVEIILILCGLVLMVGSFMVTEKLSGKELNRIAELSENEIKTILEKKLSEAENKIDDQIEEAIEGSVNRVERSLDKTTNEKMMAIHEYSDTVVEEINKTHNEIMFLYSMLNDKHGELTELAADLESRKSEIVQEMSRIQEVAVAQNQPEEIPEPVEEEQPEIAFNHNEEILSRYQQGMEPVDIAKELGLGTGEVRLVIELFKGEQDHEV